MNRESFKQRLFGFVVWFLKWMLIACAPFAVYISPAIFFGKYTYGRACLPPHLSDKLHDDFFVWPLTRLPRAANVICGLPPQIKLAGNFDPREYKGEPKPVPLPGRWVLAAQKIPTTRLWNVWLLYPAITFGNYFHIRFGAYRYDDVDHYVTIPGIGKKPVKPDWEVILWYAHQC